MKVKTCNQENLSHFFTINAMFLKENSSTFNKPDPTCQDLRRNTGLQSGNLVYLSKEEGFPPWMSLFMGPPSVRNGGAEQGAELCA